MITACRAPTQMMSLLTLSPLRYLNRLEDYCILSTLKLEPAGGWSAMESFSRLGGVASSSFFKKYNMKWFKCAWRLGSRWGWRWLYRVLGWLCLFYPSSWTRHLSHRRFRSLPFAEAVPSLSSHRSIPFSYSHRSYSANPLAEPRYLPFSSTNFASPRSVFRLPLSTALDHAWTDLNMNSLLTLTNDASLDWLMDIYDRYLSRCSTISFNFLR